MSEDIEKKNKPPSYLAKHFSDVDCSDPLNSPAHCSKCKNLAATCVDIGKGYYPGECLILACFNRNCKSASWAYCKTCKITLVAKWARKGHIDSKKHKDNAKGQVNDLISDAIIPSPEGSPANSTGHNKKRSRADFDVDEEDTFASDIMDVIDQPEEQTAQLPEAPIYPLSEAIACGNGWMLDFVRNQAKAAPSEVNEVFKNNKNMMYFYAAEHQSPPGRCGGGIRYLVARAFMKTELVEVWRMPTLDEAKYHFEAFAQYQSMNEKQRRRHLKLLSYLTREESSLKYLLTTTHNPNASDIDLYYGRQGSHSLWNTLPIPMFQNVHSIAYASPVEIVKYLFANAVPVDNMKSAVKSSQRNKRHAIVNVSESKSAEELLDRISENGNKKIIPLWATDWRDGFGPSRTKNNRNSVVAWTITIAPPKENINSTSNTFLMALGVKKNKAWPEVERMVYRDLKELAKPSSPITVYSLATKTTLQVCLGRFAAMEDKVERADATATISYSSDYHRCFGKVLKIETPKCAVSELQEYQKREVHGNIDHLMKWGWSKGFIDVQEGKNGGFLPSCYVCRQRRLHKLGVPFNVDLSDKNNCILCADWELEPTAPNIAEGLRFTPGKSYPKYYNSGCPVAPPTGREVPKNSLAVISLSFEFLKQAIRFAFYNCSIPKNDALGHKPWTKAMCSDYLRSCGVSKTVQDDLFECAKKQRQQPDQDVNYNSDDGIGSFKFPPAWSSDLPIQMHIEMLMHQLFLGIAEDSFELSDIWFKKASMGTATFRNAIQPLLRIISTFHLSWCLAHPFSGSKGSYKTGNYVSENWLAWTRLSKFIYVYAAREGSKSRRQGCEDLLRMHIAFVATVSRLLTHFGINSALIVETNDMIKEFLSCVRELDVRVRAKQINGKPGKSSPDADANPDADAEASADAGGEKANQRVSGKPDSEKAKGKKKATKEKNAYGLWWMKANYFSLFNLAPTMVWLGPLVNWWDGGGKGERFIQEIKPYIPRGIQVNSATFFVRLMEKVYKMQTISRMEKLYINEENFSIIDNNNADSDDEEDSDSNEESSYAGDTDDDDDDNDEEQDEEEDQEDTMETESSTPMVTMVVEDHHMSKSRTIYVYRRKQQLLDSIANNEPITGIVVSDGDGKKQFYGIFKSGGKSFGWTKVNFDDANGNWLYGLWYAPIAVVETETVPPQSLEGIKKVSDMAVLALPLKYVSKDDSLANKYCAITNWWTERNSKNVYVLPTLDKTLYS